MKKAVLALVIGFAAAPLAFSQAPAVASGDIPATPVAAPSLPAPTGAKVWIGRYDEYAEYLKTAPIERVTSVPIGVTKPKRAFFAPGGLAGSVVVKHLPMGQRQGFWEAYKSEIAAYEMDRLLGLDMVPVTIERRVEGDLASIQLWVEGTKWVKDVDQSTCPRPIEWAKQVCRQRVFDNLIANVDRNQGNLLVDGEWNLILIDHSRAFASDKMPFEKEMTRIDKEMFARLKALDEAGIMKHIRPWVLSDGQARNVLKRRDKIVAHFERLAQERSEAVVFPF
ncbi:MAG TPA: hypothetical protein VLL75_15335 [Vicinamibacteria bacterium]|jgi:hypothetical protein|nr:hypothetical protein [Vicinamibacteria bacterium]